jgi:Lrp/AsnC family leucine-responsive transcriptional regulator
MVDNIDKRILFELEKNARIADTQLAKIVKKSKDSVRYRIKKLEDEGIILNYKTWVDASKFGYRTSTIYLTTLNVSEKKEELLASLKKDKFVYWYGVAEGVWNIGITYFIKSNNDLFEIKNNLLTKYKDFIVDVKFTSLASVSTHEKTFLVNETSTLKTFTEKTEDLELDEIGKKVLSLLYTNSKMNLAEIADKCSSTVDIVRKRMKDYEKQGIIVRYTIEIDYEKLGIEIYKAFVYLASFTKTDLKNLMTYFEKSKKIINIVKQIAPWDFELVIFTENFKDYTNVLSDLTKLNPKIFKKIETSIMSEDVIFPCGEVCF